MTRYALIATSPKSERYSRDGAITAYLPGNYRVIAVLDGCTVIGGEDNAGWTLDDYVIPRLASGLIFAQEIDLSHPVMKQIPEMVRS
jgi:hypothetical protein